MAEHNITLNATLNDKVSANANKISSSLKDVNIKSKEAATGASVLVGALKKLAVAYVGVTGAKKLIDFGASAIKSYQQQNESIAELTNSLGYYNQSLVDLADNLQKTTKFSNTQNLEAMSSIAIFVKDEEVIKRLIPLVQDFATINEMDLASAGNLVAKSIGSSTNALSRYLPMQNLGNTSTERATTLIRELEKAYSGSAGAAAEAEGGLSILNNALSNIMSNVGEILLPYISELSKVLMQNMDSINAVAKIAVKITISIGQGVLTVSNATVGAIASIASAYVKVWTKIVKFVASSDNPLIMPKKLKDKLNSEADAYKKFYGGILDDVSEQSYESAVKRFDGMFKVFDDAYLKSISLTEKIKKNKIKKPGGGTIPGGDEPNTAAMEAQKKRQEEIKALSDTLYKQQINAEKTFNIELQGLQDDKLQNMLIDKQAEMQLLDSSLKEQLELYKGNYEAQLLAKEIYASQSAEIESKYRLEEMKIAKEKADLDAQESERRKQTVAENWNQFGQLATMSKNFFNYRRQESKAWFNFGKAMALSETMINTYSGAAAAGKSAAVIPFVGWKLAPLIQAAYIANGIMQARMIAKEKFAQGGIVGGTNFNGDQKQVLANSGEVMLNNRQMANLVLAMANNKGSGKSQQQSQTVNINVTGSDYDSRKLGRQLSGVIGTVIQTARNDNNFQRG